MKILTTLLCMHFAVVLSAQCLVPIQFAVDCDNDGSVVGDIVTSLGNVHFTVGSDGIGTAIIEGSISGPVTWTYTQDPSFMFNSCSTVSGVIPPCNNYINKDIIENYVDCEPNSSQTGNISVNSDIRVLNQITSTATHTGMTTNQYIAKESICLDPSFEVKKRSTFHAIIDDCNSAANFSLECNNQEASGWFGGDNRPNLAGRNLGEGRGVMMSRNTAIESFEFLLSSGFSFASNGMPYNNDLEIQLDIRNGQSEFLFSTTTTIAPSFSGGWVFFDLSSSDLILLGDRLYIFTFYVKDGETLQVNSAYRASLNQYGDNSPCNGFGFSGTVQSGSGDSLDDWSLWFSKPTFIANYRINGQQ